MVASSQRISSHWLQDGVLCFYSKGQSRIGRCSQSTLYIPGPKKQNPSPLKLLIAMWIPRFANTPFTSSNRSVATAWWQQHLRGGGIEIPWPAYVVSLRTFVSCNKFVGYRRKDNTDLSIILVPRLRRHIISMIATWWWWHFKILIIRLFIHTPRLTKAMKMLRKYHISPTVLFSFTHIFFSHFTYIDY